MPITSIRLKNFKCFQDSGEIEIAPLTVIFGRNNSGKSTILQSLLLLRQTLDSPEEGPRLNLRGPLYAAGSYADVVHQHQSRKHVILKFGVRPSRRKGWVGEVETEFRSGEPNPPLVVRLTVKGQNVPALELRRGKGFGGPFQLVVGGHNEGGSEKANFFFALNDFLPRIGPEPARVGRPSAIRERARSFARFALLELRFALKSLRAVGAFRSQPRRRYEFHGRLRESLDAAGADVVDALIEDAMRRRGRAELLRSVNRWLREVGRVRLLPLRRISKAARIYEVRIKDTDSGRWANFADVGFGIGQAFPVIVEGLRTPPGGLFLVQEPEIHLHPDAQLAMADFLVDLARSGRRIIVETHSEHLLLRLRRLVLGAVRNGRFRSKLKPDMVSLIYVTKDSVGTSHTRKLKLDELAQIEDWPPGFMEEATDERLAIMTAMAQRAEAGR